jgi:hypothetical protein
LQVEFEISNYRLVCSISYIFDLANIEPGVSEAGNPPLLFFTLIELVSQIPCLGGYLLRSQGQGLALHGSDLIVQYFQTTVMSIEIRIIHMCA